MVLIITLCYMYNIGGCFGYEGHFGCPFLSIVQLDEVQLSR